MNAIPKLDANFSIYDSPMPAKERVARAEIERQKMIANTPKDWFDLPEPVTLLKKLKEAEEVQGLSLIPESALEASRESVRGSVIATQMPVLSPELARMKTVTPVLVRERQYVPAKPEKKKVTSWRTMFGNALKAVSETMQSVQRYGGQLATAGIAAATLMGAVPSNGNETEVYTANNVVAVQADSINRVANDVQPEARQWLEGTWAENYAKSLGTSYQQNGYPELPEVNGLSVKVFDVNADDHKGMGLLQVLEKSSPELAKMFAQDSSLRKVAYANVWKSFDGQGWNANNLKIGTKVALTNGTVYIMNSDGKAYSANLF